MTRSRAVFPYLALLVVAAPHPVVVRAEGRDSSVLPPAAAPVAAPSVPAAAPRSSTPAERGHLRLREVRIGAEPIAWLVPGLMPKSFITNSPERLEVAAEAKLSGSEGEAKVTWKITPPAGFRLPDDAGLTGSSLHVVLLREGGNPSGAGDPLSITLTAVGEGPDGKRLEEAVTVVQDLRDRLRQEYVDLQRAGVPARLDLLDEEQFQRLYGKKYPSTSFAELNFSKIPGTEEHYPVILATERLVSTLERLRHEYPEPLVLSSGFRNPTRQAEVHAAVDESHHQYGRAADLYVAPDSAPPKTGRIVALPCDWLRLAAASLRAGGVWIEPMLDCHVNTAECHVHVDVRETGAQSRIVQLSGLVTGPDALPVAGAVVRLAGMEVLTNLEGAYRLKHVLTPHDYPLEVAPPGQPAITRVITVGEEGAVADFRLARAPAFRLTSHLVSNEPSPAAEAAAPVPSPAPSSTPAPVPAPPERSTPDLAIALLGMLLGGMAGAATRAERPQARTASEPGEEQAGSHPAE